MSDIRWRFTRRDLHGLRHHVHPIPLGRGFSEKFVTDRWPGLTFAQAMTAAGRAGVWGHDESHFAGLGVSPRVKELHLLHDGSSRVVEFTDAEMSLRDGDPDRLKFMPTGPR